MDAAVRHARQEWEESSRRFDAELRDPRQAARLLEQFEVVTAALRRRVGETFTLAELAREYAEADRWAREAVSESGPPSGWARTLSTVEGAAFHAYARGAVDYVP